MSRGQAASRPKALGLALFVTFVWSTSWVLIKIGLQDLNLSPLSFAGLRYVLASLVLLPFAVPALRAISRRPLPRGVLARVVVLGLILYAVAHGAQFVALDYLPAAAVGLILSTSPILIALIGLRTGEPPTAMQMLGILGLAAGAVLYFGPLNLGEGGLLGVAMAAACVGANAIAALMGRSLARDALPALGGVISMTALSMGAGSTALLATGIAVEGVPTLDLRAWLIIGWLAIVNTAFAFTLWNHTLRTLTAVESGVMNNLMLIQVAALAAIFLGESLDVRQVAGLGLALAGIVTVQVGARRDRGHAPELLTEDAATPIPVATDTRDDRRG